MTHINNVTYYIIQFKFRPSHSLLSLRTHNNNNLLATSRARNSNKLHMRLLAIVVRRTSPPLSSREPELSTTPAPICSPHNCRWQPYSNSNDFETNAVMILVILFCALICALVLNATVRCFLRRRRRAGSQQERKPEVGLAGVAPVVAPTVVYRAGMEGEPAECAICLSEFVEGEEVQMLGSCRHGFHAHCIQKWLSSRATCPTCRSNCLLITTCSSSSQENGQ